MEKNKELLFKVMVTSADVLQKDLIGYVIQILKL